MRFLIVALALLLSPPLGAEPLRTHGLSLIGTPKLPADFTAFPFVNPDAPKGGEMVTGAVGTFDNFNPFILAGTSAAIGAVWDTLMVQNPDEAETAYGHLARVIEVAEDGLSVAFELRPEAHFWDGHPVTAEDVAWTFETLRDKGRPNYRQYYADVDRVTVEGPLRVRFVFRQRNRELPQILGQLQVLPKHWWEGRDFTKPLSEPPLGSGPYRLARFEVGRTLVLERVPDWWGRDVPTARGLDNFDRLRIEYFRDPTVGFEAFKAGQIDLRVETSSKDWATIYGFPAVQRGLVKKEEFRHRLPTGMQGFGFNARKPMFRDKRVREALALAFDFEWTNKNLFFGAYTRTTSYFSNSDLAATGVPAGDELALLEPFRDKLPPELFTKPFELPVTDGSGNNRDQLRRALALLKDAGWDVKDRKLVDAAGEQMRFEFLLFDPKFERIVIPYTQSLTRLGIDAHVRTVDPAQYEKLTDKFEFDMTDVLFGESESPGNEQTDFWTCASAKLDGSRNLLGVCDPVIDALVAKLIAAPDHEHLVTAAHALDRVLLAGWYLVPNWHLQSTRVAYWDRFGQPDKPIRTGVDVGAWWFDPEKARVNDQGRQRSQ